MKAEILTVGTEIMVGSILNTNAKYISQKLVELGVNPLYHTSVDDNEERLKSVVSIALERADIIITSGGLGPTKDDLTKEVIAEFLNLKLIKDLEVEKALEKRFDRLNISMTDNNRKQSVRPEESEFIPNDNGTAPGIYIDKDNKKIIMLPGPPNELIPMFENHVMNLIKSDDHIIIKSINTMGIGESSLETELKELGIEESGFEIATFAKSGTVEIKIIARGKDEELLEKKIQKKLDIIKDKIGLYIYGYDNVPIEKSLVERLIEKNITLSVCESCTGGLISSKLTSIPGASAIFDRGIVTYSNRAKMEELGVEETTLINHGAVSEETAYEMAKGLKTKTNSDITLSVTGIAGPDGGTEDKPVGLVYICIMDNEKHRVIKNIFHGNRQGIQERTAVRALGEIYKFI